MDAFRFVSFTERAAVAISSTRFRVNSQFKARCRVGTIDGMIHDSYA